MIKGQKVELDFRGTKLWFRFVGAGATTYCFREIGDEKLVYLFIPDIKFKDGSSFEDTTKDSMVKAYNYNRANPYLPNLTYVARDFVGGPELNTYCKIYTVPFYRDITKKDKAQWLEMKKLHKVRDDTYHAVYDDYKKKTKEKPSMTFLGNECARAACILAKEKLNIVLYSALKTLYDNIDKEHVGITFEFNKKNVGINDETGHLILRDPIYDSEITVKIKEERKENA